MTTRERIDKLIAKWTEDSVGYRLEARRVELSDRQRHATSIVMLEASAQAIDRCVLEMKIAKLERSNSPADQESFGITLRDVF